MRIKVTGTNFFVKYNNNLDFKINDFWCNPGFGSHKGITKLKTGEIVLISLNDFSCKFEANIIDNLFAMKIIEKFNSELFTTKRFKFLKNFCEVTE